MQSHASYLVTRELAEQAVRLALPMLSSAMESREAGASGFLYIVIMRPGLKPAHCSFEEAILYEHAVGDPDAWDADYGAFARDKAELSWKTGLDGSVLQQFKPHLLTEGDTLLSGGIVYDDIVVAVSGADPWYDEAFAVTVAGLIKALAKKAVAQRSGKLALGPL